MSLGVGGSATNLTVSSGASLWFVGGSASGLTVLSGGIVHGFSNVITVPAGVSSSNLAANWGTVINVEGETDFTTISGGSERVSSGGVASGTTMYAGSSLVISDGISVDALVAGGSQRVNFGAVASHTTVEGGRQLVLGSSISGVVEFGGSALIEGIGAEAIGTTISAGGTQQVAIFATASATTVGAGGTEIIGGFGEPATAIDTTVFSSGTLEILAGGTISGPCRPIPAPSSSMRAARLLPGKSSAMASSSKPAQAVRCSARPCLPPAARWFCRLASPARPRCRVADG